MTADMSIDVRSELSHINTLRLFVTMKLNPYGILCGNFQIYLVKSIENLSV